MSAHLLRRRRSAAGSGQSLVEFALVFPLIILIVLGVFDFGRAILAANEVADAAREGARTAIVNQNTADIESRAAAQGTALGIPASCAGSGPGVCVTFLHSGSLSATPTPAACSTLEVGCQAVVTVTYQYTPLTPVISNIVGSINLTSTSAQSIESLCSGSGCPVP